MGPVSVSIIFTSGWCDGPADSRSYLSIASASWKWSQTATFSAFIDEDPIDEIRPCVLSSTNSAIRSGIAAGCRSIRRRLRI
jgi:hypothetical protein